MALTVDSIFGDSEDSLKPRWQQSGSTQVDTTASDVQAVSIYTVTTGRTLYVTSIMYTCLGGSPNTETFYDGTSTAGTIKFIGNSASDDINNIVNFTTPLQFDIGISYHQQVVLIMM